MHVLLLYLTLVSPSPEQSDITSIDFCANAPKPPTKQSTQMAVNLVTWVMNEVQSRTNLDEGKLKEVFSPSGSRNNFFPVQTNQPQQGRHRTDSKLLKGWTHYFTDDVEEEEKKKKKWRSETRNRGEQDDHKNKNSLVQFSALTNWVIGGTWGMIQQRSSSSLFCRWPL